MDAAAVRKARQAHEARQPQQVPAAPVQSEGSGTYAVRSDTDTYSVQHESTSSARAFRPRLPNLAKERIKRQFPHLAHPFVEAEHWVERRRRRKGAKGGAHREKTKRAVATALYVLEAMKGGFDFGDALDIAIAYQGIGPEDLQSTGLHRVLTGGFTVSKYLEQGDGAEWADVAAEVERRILSELPRDVQKRKVGGHIDTINLDGRRASGMLDEDDPRY